MKLAIFSHGKESGPNGGKITIMKKVAESHGFETIALDYTECKDTSERVNKLKNYIDSKSFESLLLIGSSMGGYVSTILSNEYNLIGLFLLCPALYMNNNEYTVNSFSPKCKNIEIIHGWNDEVVPYENSIKFGKQTKAIVNLVDDNHRLKKNYVFIEKIFNNFLININCCYQRCVKRQ